jgi:predicted nucleic acid-binding protein
MTVVDTSVFVDALFRFDEERSSTASKLFEIYVKLQFQSRRYLKWS